jgi:hypothetical protein
MPLEPGDKAPAIALPDQKGRKVFVFFYPSA